MGRAQLAGTVAGLAVGLAAAGFGYHDAADLAWVVTTVLGLVPAVYLGGR